MSQETVQIVSGALALILVGIIFLRRKSKKKQEDEF
jgi:LPXTG-motif cell wall-anchored protein